jgi:hypothetical protein
MNVLEPSGIRRIASAGIGGRNIDTDVIRSRSGIRPIDYIAADHIDADHENAAKNAACTGHTPTGSQTFTNLTRGSELGAQLRGGTR